MLLGEVVRGREAMAAAADDDRVVARLGRRTAPGERPVLVPGERVAREREDRVFQRDRRTLALSLARGIAYSSGLSSRGPFPPRPFTGGEPNAHRNMDTVPACRRGRRARHGRRTGAAIGYARERQAKGQA